MNAKIHPSSGFDLRTFQVSGRVNQQDTGSTISVTGNKPRKWPKGLRCRRCWTDPLALPSVVNGKPGSCRGQTRWGANETRTSKIYTNYFWRWLRYFRENQISHPGALTLKHVEDYFGWRSKRRGSQRTVGNRNTVIGEIKFLRMMMDHAVQQGYATENPAKRLVLKKDAAKEKNLWEDHEIKLVSDALSQPEKKFGWMHVTFLMGYYQADRINQCRVPLSRIDFRRHEIDYPGQIVIDGKVVNLVKGGKGYRILSDLEADRRSP
jgi:hypothetical protein